jgi:hypothetical protein
MRMFGVVLSVLLAGGVYAGSSVPVFSADNGTVNATVTVQDVACITVTSAGIDYGTKAFSTSAVPVQSSGSITSIASCSGSAQTVLIKGTPTTGTTPAWSLVNSLACPTPNQFVHEFDNPGTAGSYLALGTNNLTFQAGFASMATISSIPTRLTMPCTGSSGGGVQVSTQIIFTATVP